jgi:tricorn protease
MRRRRAQTAKKPVSTAGLTTEINPAEEWNQIFNEVWRRYRDWFYVPNMHGYDWAKIARRYKTWLPYVAHRSDLNYVIGEMISELTVQHAYIEGGDFNTPRVRASRFARARVLKLTEARIAIAFQNLRRAERRRNLSLAADGSRRERACRRLHSANQRRNVTADKDIYQYLRNRADAPVIMVVNSTPNLQGARTISYRPITDEGNLIYLDWIGTANRRRVANDERARRLHSYSRYGRERNSRIYQMVLPAAR